MSIRVMSMVWENGPEKASERMLLLALADNANDAGGRCFPSVETLARKCCLSERQVQRVLRSLEEGGWILVEFGNGRHGTNQYQIVIEKVAYTPPVSSTTPGGDEPAGVTSATAGVTSATEKGDTHVTRTTREPSLEPSLVFATAITAIDLFDTFWKEYPRDGRVESKKEARAAWSVALKKDSPGNILAGLRRQMDYMRQQIHDGRNYNKHACRWLSKELWREPVPETTQGVVSEPEYAAPDHTDWAEMNRQLDEELARKKSLEGTDDDH